MIYHLPPIKGTRNSYWNHDVFFLNHGLLGERCKNHGSHSCSFDFGTIGKPCCHSSFCSDWDPLWCSRIFSPNKNTSTHHTHGSTFHLLQCDTRSACPLSAPVNFLREKLQWKFCKMVLSNRNLLFQGPIFRGYVRFREGKWNSQKAYSPKNERLGKFAALWFPAPRWCTMEFSKYLFNFYSYFILGPWKQYQIWYHGIMMLYWFQISLDLNIYPWFLNLTLAMKIGHPSISSANDWFSGASC